MPHCLMLLLFVAIFLLLLVSHCSELCLHNSENGRMEEYHLSLLDFIEPMK